VIIPKNLPEKEPSGTYKNSKLFPENQQQMEHYKLLMVPDNVRNVLEYSGIFNKLQTDLQVSHSRRGIHSLGKFTSSCLGPVSEVLQCILLHKNAYSLLYVNTSLLATAP
jgi:hypothetical protein